MSRSVLWKPSVPKKAGKEWENVCLASFDRAEKDRTAVASRYGVQAFLNPKTRSWSVMPSNPDIEGVLKGGRQFVFDCKAVTSTPSLPLGKLRDERKKQLTHMLRRSRLGAVCFFAVYFGEWSTSLDYQPSSTWCLPVWPGHKVWTLFEEGSISMVSRLAMEEYGVPIEWHVPKGCRNAYPDLLSAIQQLAVLFDQVDAAVLEAAGKDIPNGEAKEHATVERNGRRRSASSTSCIAVEGGRVREDSSKPSEDSGEGEHAPF